MEVGHPGPGMVERPSPSPTAFEGERASDLLGRRGGGLTLRDVGSLVLGAAVASVHIRGSIPPGLPDSGWIMIWSTFAGIALTAAGPFLLLGRRFGRTTPGYPRTGDLLWTLLGLPWVVGGLIRTASGSARPRPDDPASWALVVGLGIASMVALGVVWKTWVLVPPGPRRREGASTWTERVGLGLAVAWPLQCGFGLVVMDGSS